MLSVIISSQYQICEILTKRHKILPVGLNLIELGLSGTRTGKRVADCLIYLYIVTILEKVAVSLTQVLTDQLL